MVCPGICCEKFYNLLYTGGLDALIVRTWDLSSFYHCIFLRQVILAADPEVKRPDQRYPVN